MSSSRQRQKRIVGSQWRSPNLPSLGRCRRAGSALAAGFVSGNLSRIVSARQ